MNACTCAIKSIATTTIIKIDVPPKIKPELEPNAIMKNSGNKHTMVKYNAPVKVKRVKILSI